MSSLIGDARRQDAVDALGEHLAAGRLTQGEFEQRMSLALEARTEADLVPLFIDLPASADAVAGRTVWKAKPAAEHPAKIASRWMLILSPVLFFTLLLETPFFWVIWLAYLAVFLLLNRLGSSPPRAVET